MLIELRYFNSKIIKKEILAICVWDEKRRQWQHVLELETYINDAWLFHMVLWEHVMCAEQFWDNVGYTLDETMRGETHMG